MNLKIRINKSILFYIIVLFVWMIPGRVTSLFYSYETYVQYLCQGAVGIFFLIKYGIPRPTSRFRLFFLAYLLSNVLGAFLVIQTDAVSVIKFIFWVISLWGMLSFYCYAGDDERESFFKAVRIVFIAYLALSYFYIPFNTDVNGVYFVGSRAVTVQSFIACLTLCVYYDVKKSGRISTFSWVTGLLSFLFAVMRQSGQGMMMIAVLIILVAVNLATKQLISRWFKPIAVAGIIILVNYLFISLAYLNIDIIVDFVTDVLGKDVTLTGRSEIFELTLKLFSRHPIIGYGYDNAVVADSLQSIAFAYNTAHNSMLQMLIDCGVLGTSLFAVAMYFCLKATYSDDDRAIMVLYFAIIAMFIGGLVNMIISTNFFFMVVLYAVTGGGAANTPRYRLSFNK